MSWTRRRPTFINLLIIAVTVVFVAAALLVGRAEAEPAVSLNVGQAAPETYTATRFIEIFDQRQTDAARDRAVNNVEVQYEIDPLARTRVESRIVGLFQDVRAEPFGAGREVLLESGLSEPRPTENLNEFTMEYAITVDNPSTVTRTYGLGITPQFAEAVTVLAVTYAQDLGSDDIFDRAEIAVDAGGPTWVIVSDESPRGLTARSSDSYRVEVRFAGNAELVTEASTNCTLDDGEAGTGLLAEVGATVPNATPVSQTVCRGLPTFVVPEPPAEGDETTTSSTTSTSTSTTAAPAVVGQIPTTTVPPERQVQELLRAHAVYSEAIPALVSTYAAHLAIVADGGDGFFDQVEAQIVEDAAAQLQAGIRVGELQEIQNGLIATPPRIVARDLEPEQRDELQAAAARVLALSLEANELVDEVATAERRQAVADQVENIFEQYQPNEPIVEQGQIINAVQLQAIEELKLLDPEPAASRSAAAVLGGLAVLLAALFLWRIAPSRWSQPKHIGLFGILMLIAALIARLAEILGVENPQLAYAIPAALLGYSAAILYDPRTALLTAVPMAMFTAISTQDPALTIFAATATVAPVAFVSAVSTRRELRLAVLLTALVLAPLAASVAWLFSGEEGMVEAAVFGFGGGLIGGLVAQSLVAFLENLFQVTTTVTLLDLTDRNHPALRLIEEKAPGTFNHSILVGNLAGRAARAIGASPLLAQAAAFYHDLGKTENPQFFIENQFGVSNPHDELDPAESARIIRRHVSDGLRLARHYRIPPDVAAGVEQHHGTGLMRYFYHKAMEEDPSVDPTVFRHNGRKPQRKEMAIIMISDAVEGAARALAQQEDPTAESLQKLVDSVVGEKREDGQLDESDLTFGDLTNVKRALVEALIGYYHTRIPYPGFPGPRVESS